MDWVIHLSAGDIAVTVVAGLISIWIGDAIGAARTRKADKIKFTQRTEAAVRKFITTLGLHIGNAHGASSDAEVLINVRALVQARNEMRANLTEISKQLNTQIDSLDAMTRDNKSPNISDLRGTIAVLNKTWPGKKDLLEIALKKLLVDLGITQDYDD